MQGAQARDGAVRMPEANEERDAEKTGNRAAACRIVGLGILLAWSNLAFFSKLVHFSTRNSITHLNSTYAFACLGTAVALLAVWGAWRWRTARSGMSPIPGGPAGLDLTAVHAPDELPEPFTIAWYRSIAVPAAATAGILMLVGTVVLCMVEQRLFTQPWCSIFSVVSGIGTGIMYLTWARELVAAGRRGLAVQLGLAFVVGAIVYVAVLYLPPYAGMAVCALLGPASFGLLLVCGRSNARILAPMDLEEARGRGMYLVRRSHLARTFTAMLLVGFAESFERALFMSLTPATERMANHWVLLAATAIAVASLLAASLAPRGRTFAWSVNRVLVLIMVLLFLLAPIVEGMGLAADLATMTCHFLLYMLVWFMFVRMSGEYRISVCATFAPGMGMACLGCLAGTFGGSLLISSIEPGWRLLSLLALVCAALVMVSFLFLLSEDVVTDITNGDDERPSGPRRFELRCQEVATKYGLSLRETEVMVLAAKGRTNQRIQEELGISAGTVNTHFAHIYKKLDIHERQQMLDLIDGIGRE